jgi:medium-chain acyl-[acyl-carrier-protein] hydrolase
MPPRSAWVTVTAPRPAARLRLFCLPFAGGGAKSYREWPTYLPDDVEVCLVQLPGRENRFSEPAIDQVEPLVRQLLEGVAGHLDRPFALFGHSMGALIAFELARGLRLMGLEPVQFFASGCRAPHLAAPLPLRHALPDPEFVSAIQKLNGVPHEVLQDREFIELMLPTLRSDFRLAETYDCAPRLPLSCPVTVFGGLEDRDVKRADLEAWSSHTTGPFQVRVLPGDHFFLNSSRATLLRLVSLTLRDSPHVTTYTTLVAS